VLNALLIRADGGEQMGTGHVMRTLALAQAWQDAGGSVRYAMAAPSPGIAARLNAESVEIDAIQVAPGSDDDARQIVELARKQNAAWVVVDGYQFDGNYQRLIKESGLRLLVLDDYGHADHYWADLVLNQNLHANESLYRNREPHTRLLLGVRFALLRREFLKWQGWQREISEHPRNILVTMGGSDPDNITLRVVQAIQGLSLGDVCVRVVVGGGNPHRESLVEAVASSPRFDLIYDVRNMPELLAQADMVVTAGGSTLWEIALLALPSIVIVIARNQSDATRLLSERGQCRLLGDAGSLSSLFLERAIKELFYDRECRESLSRNIAMLVDGLGGQRICQLLCESSP
jgi:UDP-2,4-diacetamido-2,4,6-trideoxy-beta-L-altropyranose hydrolase